MSKFYITTPIYYPSASPHLGSAFEAIGVDVMARYKRQCGFEVFFLTGTDEHGAKVKQKAIARGLTPQAHVDDISAQFKSLWSALHISFDDFIRTTEERHKVVVREFFRLSEQNGDIYRGDYAGWYCVRCESFLAGADIKDEHCAHCGDKAVWTREPAYFFRLSKYQQALENYIEAHPEFIQPDFRRTEIITNFLEPGLQDVCISRSTLDWGIPVPGDPSQVLYVWFDALINYVSGIGYGRERSPFEKFWPADIHVVGKDILRFHTLLWPAMLMSAGFELPKRVFSHGFLLLADKAQAGQNGAHAQKMSKSLGNVVDPKSLVERFGADAVRFFLLREMSYPHDGVYSPEKLVQRINNDLSDDLGNLVYRVLSMMERYFDGRVPSPGPSEPADDLIKRPAHHLYKDIAPLMEAFLFNRALERIWELVKAANQYVEVSKPWELNKTGQRERLATVMYNLSESLRIIADFLAPFIPETASSIRRQLALPELPGLLQESDEWTRYSSGAQVRKEPPLFPKVELPPD